MARHAAQGLLIERDRLAAIGGTLLGICGDVNHSFGFHLPATEVGSSDYSRKGRLNAPDDRDACCAIDIGMDWSASRDWLRWLIGRRQSGGLPGVLEVIGSYNGRDVRYWSWIDTPTWPTDGVAYQGTGHDRWTHVAIARSMSKQDHGILKGWSANGYTGELPVDKKDVQKFWGTDDVLDSRAMGYGEEYAKKNPGMAVKTVLQLLRRDQRSESKTIDRLAKQVDQQADQLADLATALNDIKALLENPPKAATKTARKKTS